MNCLEFRRSTLTAPLERDADYLRHLGACAECRRFAQEMASFEQRLGRTLAIEVPADLASRIKLERTIRDDKRRRERAPLHYALAASVLLLTGSTALLGYRYHQTTVNTRAFETAVLNHIYLEADHLRDDGQVQPALVNRILAPMGGLLRADFGKVRFASRCPVRDRHGAHLIVPGTVGPVTIVYLPGEHVRNRQRFSDGRFEGLLMSMTGGAMAIVGERGEPLDLTARRLQDNLTWRL